MLRVDSDSDSKVLGFTGVDSKSQFPQNHLVFRFQNKPETQDRKIETL